MLFVLTLSGCNEESNDSFAETTISIDKKGRISQQIVESFDKDYYDVNELKQEFEGAISSYNQSADTAEAIKLKDIHVEDGSVYVSLDYASAKDYSELQKEQLFVGTINDAYNAGYMMSVTLKGTQEGDKIGKVEIMGMSDKHIIILSEPVRVHAYSNIKYVSANVDVISETDARVSSESGGLAYIILDK